MILVYLDHDNIVVETDSKKILLKDYEARYLLLKLAQVLGYKVTPKKPVIKYSLSTGAVHVVLREGRISRTYTLPLAVLTKIIEALQELGPGRHEKRLVAEKVALKLKTLKHVEGMLDKYFVNNVFDWEKFLGGRQEYYMLFRVPLLLLEELGLLKESRGKYVNVTDRIEEIDTGELLGFLRARKR